MTRPLTTEAGLVRAIRRWDLVALGINLVVGAGIFGLPSKVYGLTGTASLLAYGVCAVAVALITLCFAEVGSRFTRTGGPYLYARQAFGPFLGFEVGWMAWLSRLASMAANSNLLVAYLGYFWSSADPRPWRPLIIATVLLTLCAINVLGVRDGVAVTNVFTVGKLVPLIIFVAAGLFFVDPANFSIARPPTYAGFSASTLLIVYAFSGFESVTIPTGEVRNPRRDLPFALLVTLVLVSLLYISIQVVCIGTLPDLASSSRPLADASSRFLGKSGGSIIAAGAVISIVGNLNGQTLSVPRLIFAMAEQRQLPHVLATTHRRFRTPHVSIVVTSGLALALALSGTFLQLVAVSVIARLLSYAATCAALPALRRKSDVPAPTLTVPAGLAVSAASLALCAWLLSSSTGREALSAAIAGAIGLAPYLASRRNRDGAPGGGEACSARP